MEKAIPTIKRKRDWPIDLTTLQRHIRTLVTLKETEAPVVSVYLNPQQDPAELREFTRSRVGLLTKSLSQDHLPHFQHATDRIGDFLSQGLRGKPQGAAIFARAGTRPFFLALQFGVPLPNVITVAPHPAVFHLVELKDVYHRYVVVVLNDQGARILEVNVGAVTKNVWSARPGVQAHIDPTWTREAYHHHRERQTDRFIKEKINVLDRVMSAGGYAHLVLAGNPQMAWRFRNALPHHLSTKFIEVIETSCHNTGYDIVTATIAAFLEREQEESLGMVECLLRKINTSGLALAGPHATIQALQLGIVDALIMLKSFDPEGDLKDRMVKMAEVNGCKTEIVNASDALERLGGVGCLLRYKVSPGSETNESRIGQ
jgi:hypothetical protein